MARRKSPGRPFAKGQSGNPKGRPPKSTEQSELERWKRVVDPESRDKILQKIVDCALAGKPWAVAIVVERLWPAAFVSAKINEADGAQSTSGELLQRLRDFFKPDGS